jgi:hypothetical protein
MGKKSKSARSDAKKAERHAAKAARTALYTSQAKANKRQTSRTDGTAKSSISHAIANCGNPGCKRCQPRLIPGWAFPARRLPASPGPIASAKESMRAVER